MSNGNLSVQVQGNIYATLQAKTPTDTITDNFVQPLAVNMSNGALGVNLANQIFSGQFTAAPNSTTTYNLITMNGSNDNVGNPYKLDRVKLFYFQNTGTTILSNLFVSGAAAGVNGWTSAFSGTNTLLGDTGYCLCVNPGYFGFPLATNNCLVNIINPNAWPLTYNMCVIGSTGTN